MGACDSQQRLRMLTPMAAVSLLGVTAAMATASLLAKQSEEVYQAPRGAHGARADGDSRYQGQSGSGGVSEGSPAPVRAGRVSVAGLRRQAAAHRRRTNDFPARDCGDDDRADPARKKFRVLEIGTGSGYQAAILAECVAEVDSIEVVPALGKKAEKLLEELGYDKVKVRIGDGYQGWSDRAPDDAIILTAAPPHEVPRPLLEQLKVGGRLVAPVGRSEQKLVRITRTAAGFKSEIIAGVRFVPMTGKAQDGATQ